MRIHGSFSAIGPGIIAYSTALPALRINLQIMEISSLTNSNRKPSVNPITVGFWMTMGHNVTHYIQLKKVTNVLIRTDNDVMRKPSRIMTRIHCTVSIFGAETGAQMKTFQCVTSARQPHLLVSSYFLLFLAWKANQKMDIRRKFSRRVKDVLQSVPNLSCSGLPSSLNVLHRFWFWINFCQSQRKKTVS